MADFESSSHVHRVAGVALKALLTLAGIAGFVVAALFLYGAIKGSRSAACDTSSVARDLRSEGTYEAQFWTGDLRGSRVCSIVVVARPLSAAHPRSDTLEIYDPVDGAYRPSFTFTPALTPRAGETQDVPWHFTLANAATQTVGTTVLLVGAFVQSPSTFPQYPVGILWNPVRARYAIAPLVPNKPAISRLALSNAQTEVRFAIKRKFVFNADIHHPPVAHTNYTPATRLFLPYARANFAAYTRPITFRDPLSGQRFTSYGVFRYTFVRTEEQTPALLVALAAHYSDTIKIQTSEGRAPGVKPGSGDGPIQGNELVEVQPDQLELRAWTLSATPQLRLSPCQAYNGIAEGRSVYVADTPLSQPPSLGDLWPQYLRAAECSNG